MNVRLFRTLFPILVLGLALTFASCSRKSGCPAMDTTPSKREIKKGGSSNLFSKKTRKKFKVQRR
jgi:hypothetical protein